MTYYPYQVRDGARVVVLPWSRSLAASNLLLQGIQHYDTAIDHPGDTSVVPFLTLSWPDRRPTVLGAPLAFAHLLGSQPRTTVITIVPTHTQASGRVALNRGTLAVSYYNRDHLRERHGQLSPGSLADMVRREEDATRRSAERQAESPRLTCVPCVAVNLPTPIFLSLEGGPDFIAESERAMNFRYLFVRNATIHPDWTSHTITTEVRAAPITQPELPEGSSSPLALFISIPDLDVRGGSVEERPTVRRIGPCVVRSVQGHPRGRREAKLQKILDSSIPSIFQWGNHNLEGDEIESFEATWREICALPFKDAREIVAKGVIGHYNYHGSPQFVGEGPLYVGVELEVENPRGRARPLTLEAALAGHLSGYTSWYTKHDGSLQNGFEIVSEAIDTATWRAQVPAVRNFLSRIRNLGLSAFRGGRAGLHLHFSRACWTPEMVLRLCQFVYEPGNMEIWHRWSARGSISRYAAYSLGREWWYEAADHQRGWRSEKYLALRVTRPTFELRMFRGTTATGRFVALTQLPGLLHRLASTGDLSWPNLVDNMEAHDLPEVRAEARTLLRAARELIAQRPRVVPPLELTPSSRPVPSPRGRIPPEDSVAEIDQERQRAQDHIVASHMAEALDNPEIAEYLDLMVNSVLGLRASAVIARSPDALREAKGRLAHRLLSCLPVAYVRSICGAPRGEETIAAMYRMFCRAVALRHPASIPDIMGLIPQVRELDEDDRQVVLVQLSAAIPEYRSVEWPAMFWSWLGDSVWVAADHLVRGYTAEQRETILAQAAEEVRHAGWSPERFGHLTRVASAVWRRALPRAHDTVPAALEARVAERLMRFMLQLLPSRTRDILFASYCSGTEDRRAVVARGLCHMLGFFVVSMGTSRSLLGGLNRVLEGLVPGEAVDRELFLREVDHAVPRTLEGWSRLARLFTEEDLLLACETLGIERSELPDLTQRVPVVESSEVVEVPGDAPRLFTQSVRGAPFSGNPSNVVRGNVRTPRPSASVIGPATLITDAQHREAVRDMQRTIYAAYSTVGLVDGGGGIELPQTEPETE